jgi:hypothetical protein
MRSKNYGINVRVTEQEKQKLLENARFCSLSLSEYLRRLGLGKEVRAAITERDLPPVSDAERPESGASTASERGTSEQAGSNFE